MIQAMRERALKAERRAQSARTSSARERARGVSDAACWWYARHVELLVGQPDIVATFVREAAAIAAAEETRGVADRASGRREVDAWIVSGFERRWREESRLRHR